MEGRYLMKYVLESRSVDCKQCFWQGTQDDLLFEKDYETGEVIESVCPECGSWELLMHDFYRGKNDN